MLSSSICMACLCTRTAQQAFLNRLRCATSFPCFTFSITDDLTRWRVGQFGDAKSCFAGRTHVLSAMKKAGGTALCLYNQGVGSGRTWVLPYEGHPVLINAYGPAMDGFRARLRILLPDASTHMVTTKNNGFEMGDLWINLGVGLWVGEQDERPPDSIDFRIKTNGRPPVTCDICTHEYEDSLSFVRDGHGNIVCGNCRVNMRQDAVSGRWYHMSELIAVHMVISGDRGWERGQGWLLPSNVGRLVVCNGCNLPVQGNAVYHYSVDGHEYEACRLCDANMSELEWPYTCRSCGRYIKEYTEVCVCGGKAKYKR